MRQQHHTRNQLITALYEHQGSATKVAKAYRYQGRDHVRNAMLLHGIPGPTAPLPGSRYSIKFVRTDSTIYHEAQIWMGRKYLPAACIDTILHMQIESSWIPILQKLNGRYLFRKLWDDSAEFFVAQWDIVYGTCTHRAVVKKSDCLRAWAPDDQTSFAQITDHLTGIREAPCTLRKPTDRITMAAIARRLKLIREDKNMPLSDFATKMKWVESYTDLVESGQRTIGVLAFIRMCQALEVSPSALIEEALNENLRTKESRTGTS